MSSAGLSAYGALCGVELWNAARLKAYVDRGIVPSGFNVTCAGCDGLPGILPCINSEAPECGYQLPELPLHVDGEDNERFWAPWYDPKVPESKNFAGLLVTSATMSAPYSREVTNNIGNGGVLGRLRLQPRTIVIHGFLIGKTCCATQYGLEWLTAALQGAGGCDGDCGGCEFDFLACCPDKGAAPENCVGTDCDSEGYERPAELSEYQRAQDFWRRMHDVGVVSGPDVISCKGNSCGCGCGALIEVEFTLAAGNPYIFHLGKDVLDAEAGDIDCNFCGVEWVKVKPGQLCPSSDDCPDLPSCLDDPLCPPPTPPPLPSPISEPDCGCPTWATSRVTSTVAPGRDWGSSTLNFEVYAGDKDLRNLAIRVWQNPLGKDCLTSGCEGYPKQPGEFQMTCRTTQLVPGSAAGTSWCDSDDGTSTDVAAGEWDGVVLDAFTPPTGYDEVIGVRLLLHLSTKSPETDDPNLNNPAEIQVEVGFGNDSGEFTNSTLLTLPSTDNLVREYSVTLPLTTAQAAALKSGPTDALLKVIQKDGDEPVAVTVHQYQTLVTVAPKHCIPDFPDCAACATLIVKYVPARGTLKFSGEERRVTVDCGTDSVNALRNIGSADGNGPFDWPDLECTPICVAVDFDCFTTADNASVNIEQVYRDL